MNPQRGRLSSLTTPLGHQHPCQQNTVLTFVQLCECFFSVMLQSSPRRQRWTCCRSPLMIHPISTITTILMLHLFLRASKQLSVALSPLLSSHLNLPSSTMIFGVTTCPLPLLKTLKRKMSLNVSDHPATDGRCESAFCSIGQLELWLATVAVCSSSCSGNLLTLMKPWLEHTIFEVLPHLSS